jgi:hypothetical protein
MQITLEQYGLWRKLDAEKRKSSKTSERARNWAVSQRR